MALNFATLNVRGPSKCVCLLDEFSNLRVHVTAVQETHFTCAAVYVPNINAERVSFFRRFAPFLDDPKRIVLVGDWNVILDPKIDRVGRGA